MCGTALLLRAFTHIVATHIVLWSYPSAAQPTHRNETLKTSGRMDDIQGVVIDGGGYASRVGWAGDDDPKRTLRASDCGLVRQRMAIERRAVTHWCDMEQTWAQGFEEIGCTPAEHPVLLTAPAFCPAENSERSAEVMFESFNVPAWMAAQQSELAVYASGRASAMVLDIGEGSAHAVPVYEGTVADGAGEQMSLPMYDEWSGSAAKRLDLAGGDITTMLSTLLGQLDATPALRPLLDSHGDSPLETAEAWKQRFGFVCPVPANNPDRNRVDKRKAVVDQLVLVGDELTLPDGSTISFAADAVLQSGLDRCTEALFRPEVAGLEAPGVAQLVADAVRDAARGRCPSADAEVSQLMWGNVVVAGGSTMLRGFQQRLQAELRLLAPPGTRVHVVAPPERKRSVWIGGSILASLSTFQPRWISRQRYDEEGAASVVRALNWQRM
jgi:actin-related protein